MANIRMSRINGEIQKAIAEIIANRLNNPNLDGYIISIIDVDTSADLSLAKVAVSVLSTPETKRLVTAELNHCKGYIRHELAKMIRLKTIPDIVFEEDNTYEKGQKLLNLIDQVSKDNKNE